MSSPTPREEQLLAGARSALEEEIAGIAPESDPARLDVLEAVASRLGGFSLPDYRRRFQRPTAVSVARAVTAADRVLQRLQQSPIHPALALCALARPGLSETDRRRSGAYYTDFRLAQHLAANARPFLVDGAKVTDPASGTGILLVAAVLAACGPDRHRRARWLAESIFAADLSAHALCGARLALASLTDDLGAVRRLEAHARCHDSLLAAAPAGGSFDVVLANPPWERLKATRHEFLRAAGDARHYGDDYAAIDEAGYSSARAGVTSYALAIAERYPFLGTGEPDLYKCFLELVVRLVRPGGCASVLVPAGLIRSQGTAALRSHLFREAREVRFTVFENRARFFAIDTRFKFLSLCLTRGGTARDVDLRHGQGTDAGVTVTGRARLGVAALAKIRPDLTVPEVRSAGEWRLFRALSRRGGRWDAPASAWHPEIVREIDMTRDRRRFLRARAADTLPLVEGRMIHQYRLGAKVHRHGTGRRAKWETTAPGPVVLGPQFWYPAAALTAAGAARSQAWRAGFCDITGQTNERSLLAALVPPGVVCGNKVPTMTFPGDARRDRLLLWLAVVNSVPFDWALRRVVTTTVNYFLLMSVPLPPLDPDSLPGRRLVAAARELTAAAGAATTPGGGWRAAELRAAIDVGVLTAYGGSYRDLQLMLEDFPLLDRGQPPLPGEPRSTITRDFLLLRAARRFGQRAAALATRVAVARQAGAVPYVPSEYVGGAGVTADEVHDA